MNRPFGLVSSILVIGMLLVVTGCGGGGVYEGEVVVVEHFPVADIDVDNQTDLSASFLYLTYFEMAQSYGPFVTGNMLPFEVAPGETVYVGAVDEDVYDAFADLEGLATVTWIERPVHGYDLFEVDVY